MSKISSKNDVLNALMIARNNTKIVPIDEVPNYKIRLGIKNYIANTLSKLIEESKGKDLGPHVLLRYRKALPFAAELASCIKLDVPVETPNDLIDALVETYGKVLVEWIKADAKNNMSIESLILTVQANPFVITLTEENIV